MTNGYYEREPKELPEDNFRIEYINSETLETLKHIPIPPYEPILTAQGWEGTIAIRSRGTGLYGFIELTTDAEWREALGAPRLVGPDLVDTSEPRDWDTSQNVKIELPEQASDAQSTASYVVASEVTPNEVVDMLHKALRPTSDDDNS